MNVETERPLRGLWLGKAAAPLTHSQTASNKTLMMVLLDNTRHTLFDISYHNHSVHACTMCKDHWTPVHTCSGTSLNQGD